MVGIEGLDVAKRKEASGPERRTASVHFMTGPTWKAWLERFARKQRRSIASQVELALERLAEEEGFEKPPER